MFSGFGVVGGGGGGSCWADGCGEKESNIMARIHLHDFTGSDRQIQLVNSTIWVLYQ